MKFTFLRGGMKKIFLSVILLLSLLSTGCSSLSPQTEALIGKPAPFTRLSLLDDEYVSLNRYRGKTLILIFWASWCSHSKSLMEDLNDYIHEHPNHRAEIIAVSVDKMDNLTKLRNMIYLQGYDKIKHAFSGNGTHDEAFLSFRLVSVPTVIVISPKGIVLEASNSFSTVRRYWNE